jgi:hypothetical protein
MSAGIVFVWGFALLTIAGLAIAIAGTHWRQRSVADAGATSPIEGLPGLAHDTLLFYYERSSVRQTADQRVTIVLPGRAWDAEWREDLLRIEIQEMTPRPFALSDESEPARGVTVYELSAFRMTEMGIDLEIDHFLEPIAVILTAEDRVGALEFAAQGSDGIWHVVTQPLTESEAEAAQLSPGQRAIKGEITHLGKIGLTEAAS